VNGSFTVKKIYRSLYNTGWKPSSRSAGTKVFLFSYTPE
jgi:hypothetical protein